MVACCRTLMWITSDFTPFLLVYRVFPALPQKHDTPTDMKSLAQQLGYGNITLRFSDAKTLATNLGTTQGNVSPLALINDTAQLVNVAIDRNLLDEGGPVLVHPLTNEASVELNIKDILSFIEQTGHTWVTVEF